MRRSQSIGSQNGSDLGKNIKRKLKKDEEDNRRKSIDKNEK
jgi:hypothetical protein